LGSFMGLQSDPPVSVPRGIGAAYHRELL